MVVRQPLRPVTTRIKKRAEHVRVNATHTSWSKSAITNLGDEAITVAAATGGGAAAALGGGGGGGPPLGGGGGPPLGGGGGPA